MSEKFRWVEVNRDHAPTLPKRFNVSAYPSLLVVGRDDEKIYRFQSFMLPKEFRKHLKEGLRRHDLYKKGKKWDLRPPRAATICDGAAVQTIKAPTEEQPGGAAVMGGKLFTAQGRKLHRVDLASGEVEETWSLPRPVRGLCSDGKLLYAVDYGWTAGKPIYVIDPTSGEVVREIVTEANKANRYMAASGITFVEGKLLVLALSNKLYEVDTKTGEVITTRSLPERGWKLEFDGKHIVTATHVSAKKGSLLFVDPTTLKIVRRTPLNYGVSAIAHRDGAYLLTEQPVLGFDTNHKRVRLWPDQMLIHEVRLPQQDKQKKPQDKPTAAPASDLPRVLLIGDSISRGYTKPVQRLMQGRAFVARNPGNAAHTSRGVANISTWLAAATGKWDVVHFNFGLHDLAYRNANGKGLNKKSGKQSHPPKQYAANLEKIVAQLEKTGAELIFATTTPVPLGEPGRVVGDAVKYNAFALKIMRAHGIGIDDLHGVMAGRMKEFATKPGNVHFTKQGSMLLAKQVVKSIDRALKQRASAKISKKKKARKPRWEPTKKVIYKKIGDVELRLHVFEPDNHKTSDRRAAIVFFFGGGWNGGTPAQFYPHCDYLAGRGMVAISAEYRVKNKHKTTPFECVADGKSAVRFVRMNAGRMGIDSGKVAAGGGSAGGHVAAAVATVPGFEEEGQSVSAVPDALVLFNPVYDNGPEGYGYKRVKARFREISPMHNIRKGIAPTIVFLGTKDSLIPVATGKKFQAAMRKAGSQSELELYVGRAHGFFNHGRGNGSDYQDTIRKMDRFLGFLGYLEGKPTLR